MQNTDVSQADFWSNRYNLGETQWDIGQISPPLKAYIDHLCEQGVAKTSKILLAGAGNAYEASYLHAKGFSDVYVLDFASIPLANFAKNNPTFSHDHLLQADFFTLDPQVYQFDFIIERTFFCAIDPSRREAYAKQMANLLYPSGELFGVLFNKEFEQNPPFGGNLASYQTLFSPYFKIKTLQPCYNSISPRQGSELFVVLKSLKHG